MKKRTKPFGTSAELLLQKAQAAVKMLEADLFRHRGMLDVDPDEMAEILSHVTTAMVILEPSYKGKTFGVNDVVNFDERVLVTFPGSRR